MLYSLRSGLSLIGFESLDLVLMADAVPRVRLLPMVSNGIPSLPVSERFEFVPV